MLTPGETTYLFYGASTGIFTATVVILVLIVAGRLFK